MKKKKTYKELEEIIDELQQEITQLEDEISSLEDEISNITDEYDKREEMLVEIAELIKDRE